MAVGLVTVPTADMDEGKFNGWFQLEGDSCQRDTLLKH